MMSVIEKQQGKPANPVLTSTSTCKDQKMLSCVDKRVYSSEIVCRNNAINMLKQGYALRPPVHKKYCRNSETVFN